MNKYDGWDYDEVKAEFDNYFANNDLSEFQDEDWAQLELQMQETINLFEKGIKSGKVENGQSYDVEGTVDRMRYKHLYDMALDSAEENGSYLSRQEVSPEQDAIEEEDNNYYRLMLIGLIILVAGILFATCYLC